MSRTVPSLRNGLKRWPHLRRIERLFDETYSHDDGEADPELTRFSLEHDRQYILPVLRQADRRILTCFFFHLLGPAWLDEVQWHHAGWVDAQSRLRGLQEMLLKFLEGYGSESVPVQALTTQNEVDTDQEGRMPPLPLGAGVRNSVHSRPSGLLAP